MSIGLPRARHSRSQKPAFKACCSGASGEQRCAAVLNRFKEIPAQISRFPTSPIRSDGLRAHGSTSQAAHNIFYGVTLFYALLFAVLVFNTEQRIAQRSNAARLACGLARAVLWRRRWQGLTVAKVIDGLPVVR